MIANSYDKWNSVVASSDEDDEEMPIPIPRSMRNRPVMTDSTGLYVLHTVPWDSSCEMARWALDKHGASYEEAEMPWGIHLWTILGLSEPMPKQQQTSTPVLVNHKNEASVFRTPTDIIMYLFSQAFSGRIRLYSPASALDLQEEFDNKLAVAARTIYLHTMLSNPSLAKKYLADRIYLNQWRVLNQVLWPLLRRAMWYYYGLGKTDTLDAAWQTVASTFEQVEAILIETHKSKTVNVPKIVADLSNFLTGKTLTAADISFASHAALVLFPHEDDSYGGGKIKLPLPSLSELPKQLSERVQALRRTAAGQYASRLYRKERGKCLARRPSKHSKANNPDWANAHILRTMAINRISPIILAVLVPVMFLPLWLAIVAWLICIAGAYYGVYLPNKDSVVVQRMRQIWFVLSQPRTLAKTTSESK
eukprot:jgi/Hompol1/810/HPOL_004514-RA